MTKEVFDYSKAQLKSGQKTLARIRMNNGDCFYSHQIQKRTKMNWTDDTVEFQYHFNTDNLTRKVVLYYKDIQKIQFN